MDNAGDAALSLLLGRLSPDVDCVSIICHANSFTAARKERFQEILPSTAKFREIRVIDDHDREYIIIKESSESYYITSPADILPESHPIFAKQNLRITPPHSPRKFIKNYKSLSSKFVKGLEGGEQIQRIGFSLDYLPSISVIFQSLHLHSNLQELELIEPITFSLSGITREAATELKSSLIDFLHNSNIVYLTIPLPLITPTTLRALNELPKLRMLKIRPVDGFCSVPYLCDIAMRAVRDFNFIEAVNVEANTKDEITVESVALLQTTFPTTIVYQS
jgi:hypothetical protein